MLNELQVNIAMRYAEGMPITDIAKVCGCSRPTVYTALEKKEVKAEVDRCLQEIKTTGAKIINNKLITYINEIEKIALGDSSDKTKLDALQYLVNRSLGTPTNKTQEVQEQQVQEEINLDVVKDKVANVINIDTKAK